MAFRCKLVAKQDLPYGKIKKGDVITFTTNSNSGNPDIKLMCQAVASYCGFTDWTKANTIAQYHQYTITYERI